MIDLTILEQLSNQNLNELLDDPECDELTKYRIKLILNKRNEEFIEFKQAFLT